MSDEQWMADHKGKFLRTVAQVWRCMDDYCDCTQPQIVDIFQNRRVHNAVAYLLVWEGKFRTDGEPGAEKELAAKRAELARTDPEYEARIVWPAPDTEGEGT